MADILNQDIKFLKGVGPNRAKTLGDELKVFTVRDLLYTFPFKYIDRSVIFTIRELREDMSYVQIVGKITDLETEGGRPQASLEGDIYRRDGLCGDCLV